MAAQNSYGSIFGMELQTVENRGMTRIIAIDSEGLYLTIPAAKTVL